MIEKESREETDLAMTKPMSGDRDPDSSFDLDQGLRPDSLDFELELTDGADSQLLRDFEFQRDRDLFDQSTTTLRLAVDVPDSDTTKVAGVALPIEAAGNLLSKAQEKAAEHGEHVHMAAHALLDVHSHMMSGSGKLEDLIHEQHNASGWQKVLARPLSSLVHLVGHDPTEPQSTMSRVVNFVEHMVPFFGSFVTYSDAVLKQEKYVELLAEGKIDTAQEMQDTARRQYLRAVLELGLSPLTAEAGIAVEVAEGALKAEGVLNTANKNTPELVNKAFDPLIDIEEVRHFVDHMLQMEMSNEHQALFEELP